MKILALDRSVHDLVEDYPELLDILVQLGFRDIAKPGMLKSVGRFMTLDKGAKMKRIELGTLVEQLEEHGFTVVPGSTDS